MSAILPGSPAKLERFERHLIRQRGAGVRNLATSFGFSLALAIAAPSNVSDHPEEPPAKRRKSVHTVTEERASNGPVELPEASAAKVKPNVRRRFETVEEDEAPAVSEDGHESFASTVKKRGRPKKTRVHVEANEDPVIPAAVPEKRPRRNAAVSALAKVTEGFAEEAQPIDKKRRDPELEKPVRKGRKKAAPVVTLEAVNADSDSKANQQGASVCLTMPDKQDAPPVEIMKETEPMDKKRRDPELEKPVRKGRKKTASACTSGPGIDDLDAKDKEQEAEVCLTVPEQQGAQPVEIMEETEPMDKKRRDPELEKPIRKGRKKVVPAGTLEAGIDDLDVKGKQQKAADCLMVPEQQDAPPVEITKEKKTARPAKRKPKLKTAESPAKRIPLGETHANIPSRSPEKCAKTMGKDVARSCSPNAPGKTVKTKVKATKRSSKKLSTEDEASNSPQNLPVEDEAFRSPDQAVVTIANHSTVDEQTLIDPSAKRPEQCDGTDSNCKGPSKVKSRSKAAVASKIRKVVAQTGEENSSEDCAIIAEKSEESCLPPATVKHSKVSSPPTLLRQATTPEEPKRVDGARQFKDKEEEVASRREPKDLINGTTMVTKPANLQKQKASQKPKRSDAAQSKSRLEPPDLGRNPKEEEDLDWLFETNEKRKGPRPPPPRQSRRKAAPAKVARRAASPEVDLDEMFSNIASWAPKGRG